MQQNCFSPENPVISIGFHAEFLSVFIRLIETVKHEGPAFQQIASCLVIQLLGLVYASALIRQRKTRPRQEQIVQAIRYHILEAWDQELDFAQLAQDHHVSYVWFRKAFKELIGTAPGQYHLQVRLEKTAQLLKETDLTVSEIAYRAGFESEFYFSRIFKKKMGVTPTCYRKGGAVAQVHG
ncbi:MAG: AraC family transcriptional regulator [Bacteroidia bacterium]|nr:AraC family transcriptional regulator [Bacteroidia bacterium]